MASAVQSLFVNLACVVAFAPLLCHGDPVVNTTSGMVRGLHLTYDGREDTTNDLYLYKGIPYAEPPVGLLRFSAPVPKTPWTGIFNASRFGPSCPQNLSAVAQFYPYYVVRIPEEATMISEDCLTLNVYSPFNISKGSAAVMVWIHGGAFETGQGSGYDASALAVRGRVVVVTLNYRLNVFGFLATNDENAPGNYGLLDQQLALKWVHDNIAEFGGDPEQVTLLGQSAGAASVFIHLFALGSRPLFHRLAAHSGVFLPQYAMGLREKAAITAKKIARATGIHSVTDNAELIRQLRDLPMDKLLSAALYVADNSPQQLFLPVLDNNIVSSATGNTDLQVDVIILTTSGDGSAGLDILGLLLLNDIDPSIGVTEEQWTGLLIALGLSDVLKVATTYQYTDDTTRDRNFARMKAVVDTFLDVNFVLPVVSALEVLQTSPSTRSYVSVFDHRSSANNRLPRLNLVPHSEEISYLFGLPLNGLSSMGSFFTEEERDLSNRLIQYWSNFAKSGDPNVNPDANTSAQDNGLTYWPEYGEAENYLLIQLNDSTVGQGYRKDKVKFWTDYLPKLSRAAAESCPATQTSDPPSTVAKPECKEILFGGGLGLKLTAEQAETLIEAFTFLVIALLVLLVLLIGAMLGFRFRSRAKKARPKGNGKVKQTNGEINKNSVFEVNEGFITESEDTKM